MKEWLCKFQGTILESKLNIYISRCECSECPLYLSMLSKEVCERCPHRILPDTVDRWAGSFTDTTQEIMKRQEQTVKQLFADYCQGCEHLENGVCCKLDCCCPIPIEDLMRHPNICCPLGLWE